jgi:hypothetical protein
MYNDIYGVTVCVLHRDIPEDFTHTHTCIEIDTNGAFTCLCDTGIPEQHFLEIVEIDNMEYIIHSILSNRIKWIFSVARALQMFLDGEIIKYIHRNSWKPHNKSDPKR